MNHQENILLRIWNLIYPILLYYVVANVVMYMAMILLQIDSETLEEAYTLLETISVVVALPVLYPFYRKDRLLCQVHRQRWEKNKNAFTGKEKVLLGVFALGTGLCGGTALNFLIGATGLMEVSSNYQSITSTFFASSLWVELLGLGILIPLLEELLYRGIVYGRLSDWSKIPVAAIFSSFIFGALHLNLVQFLYAFLLALAFTVLLEKGGSLLYAVLAHVGANTFTVLRAECGWLQMKSVVGFWCLTFLFLLAGVLFFCGFIFLKKIEKNS